MADLKTVHIDLPARTENLRQLEIGSVAYLTGRVFTVPETGEVNADFTLGINNLPQY